MMRKLLLASLVVLSSLSLIAQNIGDTVEVRTFNYSQTYGVNQWSPGIRDTMINFPDNLNISYEKILMLYNMRCKGGNISSGTNRDVGCGEWDISCNTYITDSSRVDSVLAHHPSHIISGFSGSSFDYTSQEVYNLLQFVQRNTTATSVINETQSTIGNGNLSLPNVLQPDQKSSKSQYLFTEAELTAAGVVTGDIDGVVLNALNGSKAEFLRVKIKHTTAANLDVNNVDQGGFTEVYFASVNFSNGGNRLQFYTPFNWDGVSNLLLELSTTNSTPGSILNIEGDSTSFISAVSAVNNYHINTTGGSSFAIPSSVFNTVNNEISLSFWSKGNPGVSSVNTTIILGKDAGGNRQLNIHLPWGNSQVFLDCGNNGSAYDRINKTAGAQILENSWNHWAFTKNGVSGEMKIYLNGNLWHSGSGKNNTITIDTLVFGATENLSRTYPGVVDELRIWDKELSQTEIQNWMNRPLDNTHPQHTSLIAHYQLNEGSGNTVANSVNTQISPFLKTPVWGFERGKDLGRMFNESNKRPNVSFLQGSYNLSVVMDTVYDSLRVIPNNIREFQIISQSGTSEDDVINELSSNNYWEASYRYVLDGSSGLKLDSISITPDGTINISDLVYYRRDPSKFEIMSFVTPYGINLDLGPSGKTWTFDVTDFAPILKGRKRMTIERGGQWMEDMDIRFLYIVGTPPRDVLDIQQLWKVESRGYQSIMADDYYEPRNVSLLANAQQFKIRSAITGHGQEGEFIPRNHFVNLNGGANEFTWQVWKECAENPVYPQGGTWIYDRAGWCPGMATDVREFEITPFVTAGQTANIDYGVTTASGTSNYIVNHQLVSYGAPNYNLDAAVSDVIGPSTSVEHQRFNALCVNPKIKIQNRGVNKLTSLVIEYWINNAQNKQQFVWNGDLEFLESELIELPSPWELWNSISGSGNKFHVELKSPNGAADDYTYNDKYTSDFSIPDVLPNEFALWFRTNSVPSENKIELFDLSGNRIFLRDQMAANTLYRDTFNLPTGCYKLLITDTDDDGLSFFANNDGNGSAFIRQLGGGVLKSLNPNFGGFLEYNFTVGGPLSYDVMQARLAQIKVYPNPAGNEVFIAMDKVNEWDMKIYNSLGQRLKPDVDGGENVLHLNTTYLARGVYTIILSKGDKRYTQRVVLR